MANKLNIYLDVANLSIVGDEFRYKYSYEEIVYMIDNITVEQEKLQISFNNLQTKLNKVGEGLTTATGNIMMLTAIKDAIEAADPSTYAEEPEEPTAELPTEEEPPLTGNFVL